jgi:3'-phosphoadenosine 5'-phosphosulfate sulfotransferase (PAPS reductase)/FAD synthetase
MKKETKREIFVIANSGGRSSAYMTERLLKSAEREYIVTFQNTGKENNETLDFLRSCEMRWAALYGQKMIWLEYNPELPTLFEIVNYFSAHRTKDANTPFEKLIRNRKHLPNVVQRSCTSELKIMTSKRYILSLGYKHWTNCIGLRFDEPKRYEKQKDLRTRQRWDLWFPMVDWKITKQDVNDFWAGMPFDLKLKPYQGNCDLCFLKGMGKKRMIMRENRGSADWWVKMETEKKESFAKDYTYKELLNGLDSAPEFAFGENYECDIPCFCSID